MRLVILLPGGGAIRGRDLDSRDLVFRTVGGPVGEIGGDHIGLGARMVEGGVDHAGRHAFGDGGAQGCLARAACQLDQIAFADAALFGVVGMDFEPVLGVPGDVFRAPCLRADIVLAQDPAGGEQQREARAGAFVGGHIFGTDELALAADEAIEMHDRRAVRLGLVAGHCTEPFSSSS